jgi:hypothetical protein
MYDKKIFSKSKHLCFKCTFISNLRPEIMETKFQVLVKLEPEQGFEIPATDWPEPECREKKCGSCNKNQNCAWTNPVFGSGS